MRIISLNLNGIRSAYNKGLLEWLAQQNTDILCVQELKAQAPDMTPDMLAPLGYHGYFHYAEKKGYSGVGIYSKTKPDNVIVGLGIPEFDAEGRYIEAQFGNLSVVSLYLPSGSSGEERQAVKFKFMEAFMPHLRQMMSDSTASVGGESRLLPQTAGSASNVSQPHMDALKQSGRDIIICGDWNIAHTEKDLRNWKGNKKNSGFLPEERAWLTELFNEVGFVDVFRKLHPELEAYTWWSNRGQAWAKDVGWRIDYQIATPDIAAKAVATGIYKEQRFSDHAPLLMDYEM
jgi:exodeoxyribonuclease-3